MDILPHIIHYSLHYLFPGLVAFIFFRKYWKKAWIILVATMLVDLDHLLVRPIFDPNRCGVGFHVLHSEYAIMFYFILFLIPKTRIIGLGLLMHMATDSLDCFLM